MERDQIHRITAMVNSVDLHQQWQVVIPVKRLAYAKSRLREIRTADRSRLAHAFAADVVSAAVGAMNVRRAIVVTEDDLITATSSSLGADVIDQGGRQGLNGAIWSGLVEARRHDASGRVAVVPADLPALTSQQIDGALVAAEEFPLAVVADSNGSGTVLLCENRRFSDGVLGVAGMVPRFGDGSYQRHSNAGHVGLAGDWPGLRRDVDTFEDLSDILTVSLGPHTTEVLGSLHPHYG